MGRPSSFSQEIADAICVRLADGQSLREVCRTEGMPNKETVRRWLMDNEPFRAQYARAKSEGIEAMADEILDIADDARNDWMERLGDDGQPAGWVFNGEAARRSALRVETRKWLLSKLAPRKYGEKLALTGPDGGPMQHVALNAEEFRAIAKDIAGEV